MFLRKVAQRNGFEPICTCRLSTLKMMEHSNSTKRSIKSRVIRAIYYWYNTRGKDQLIICAVAIRLVICVMYAVLEIFYFFVIGVRLILLPERVVFPFSLPAVGTLSQIDVVVCTFVYEKHAIAHALFVFFFL